MQSKIAVLAMMLAVQAGCGRAKAPTVQPRGAVAPPAYPVDPSQAFQLTDAKTSYEFNSNVLLWDEPTGPQVRAILDVTQQTRIIRAEALDLIKREIVPARQKLDELLTVSVGAEQKIEAARAGRDLSAVRSYMHSVVDTYVESTLDRLAAGSAITAADQAHAKMMWAGYCEGKLLEFAVSPLLTRLYAERPTPTALCEGYYASRHYFADTDLCGPAQAAGGKDYFSCVWNAGVIKSQLMPSPDVTTAPACAGSANVTRVQAITKWVARDGSGPLRDLLRSNEQVSRDDAIMTYARTLSAAILGGNNFSRALTTRSPELGKCRNAFNRFPGPIPAGRDVDAAGVPYWRQDNPTSLVAIGESDPTASSQLRYYLLPQSSDAAVNSANFAKLGAVIIPFAKRDVVAGVVQPSYSDEQLNMVIGQPELRTSQSYRDGVERGPLLPQLAALDTAELRDLKLRLASAPAAVAQAQAEFDAKKDAFNKITLEGIRKNITDAAAIGEVEGASVFLNTYVLNISRDGDKLQARLAFEHMTEQVQVGCLNLNTGVPCDVAPEALGANGHVASVAFDRSSSLITLTFGLGEHPENLGFPVHPRNIAGGDIPFNAIAPANLVGKSFQVEVYGNQLRDLPIVTGNAYILDADGRTRLYSGSLTGDAFYQIRRQLSQAHGLGI